MSVILEFHRTESEKLSRYGRSSSSEPSHEAEIVIFPGVRIERTGGRTLAMGTANRVVGSEAPQASCPGDGAD